MSESVYQSSFRAIATATGQSDHIDLPEGGDWVLAFSSAGAFVLDVQVGPEWADLYDSAGVVSIDSSSGRQHVRVSGGQQYRMDVGTYNSAITMQARKV